jgi:transposase
MSRKKTAKNQNQWAELPTVHPHAAGLDISATDIVACVPADRDERPIRTFGVYTQDLEELADWLIACGIETAAMESTGVYWIPVYEVLETRKLDLYLVDARHLKNVPGHKSDVSDSQWIQTLHSYGLLHKAFVPEANVRALRAYWRQRTMLVEHRAAHIQHMQKALQQMNLHLTAVLSDITGVTGMQIIRAIVDGEHDPRRLAQMRDRRCQRTEQEIIKALSGNYRPEHLFSLQQALRLYDVYSQAISECDAQLKEQYQSMAGLDDDDAGTPLPPLPPLPPAKQGSHCKNAPAFEAREEVYRLLGVDLVSVTGLQENLVQGILTEIGFDVTPWPTVKHFCSWLSLAPHNDVSGGKVLRSRTHKHRNRAGQSFRLAAQSVMRSANPYGIFYRRLAARIGKQQAMVATAHKIARAVYAMLKYRRPFELVAAQEYERRLREQEIARLRKRATRLGMNLVPLTT